LGQGKHCGREGTAGRTYKEEVHRWDKEEIVKGKKGIKDIQ
jgi:hypothetical protein